MSRHLLPFLNLGPYYFWRTAPDGTRQVSWRTWVLIWVAPVLFLAAALMLALATLAFQAGAQRVEAEVVRVYAWDDWTPTQGQTTVYGPVFRYTHADGTLTEASLGQSSTNWNFPLGSRHHVWARNDRKDNLMLDSFEHKWGVATVIGLIGAALALLASWPTARLRRWQRDGTSKAG